jgi:hypothetical protein
MAKAIYQARVEGCVVVVLGLEPRSAKQRQRSNGRSKVLCMCASQVAQVPHEMQALVARTVIVAVICAYWLLHESSEVAAAVYNEEVHGFASQASGHRLTCFPSCLRQPAMWPYDWNGCPVPV